MSQFPSPKEVERIKKMYPKGTRIQIERIDDIFHFRHREEAATSVAAPIYYSFLFLRITINNR